MTDDDPEIAKMFGKPAPRKAVTPKPPTHLDGYRPRPKFRRRSDGRLYPMLEPAREIETELPNEQCPDGTLSGRREDRAERR